MFDALVAAQDDPSAIYGLDFDVLAHANAGDRAEIFRIVLERGASDNRGVGLLARLIVSTPDEELITYETTILQPEVMRELASAKGTARLPLGRAYTMKTLSIRPLGGAGLDNLPVYRIGQSGSKKWWVDVKVEAVPSTAVAQEQWPVEEAISIGNEPALPGQQPGPTTTTGLRFSGVEWYTPWYGLGAHTLTGGGFDPYSKHIDDRVWSPYYHPSQLLRVVIEGTDQEMISTGFEVAVVGPIADPWREIFLPGVMKVVNLWAMYFSGRSFITSMGTAGALTRAATTQAGRTAAEAAASQITRQALHRLLYDTLILGSFTVVDHYRDKLSKSAAGRTFLAIFDVTIGALLVRDVFRLYTSGVLGRLADAAWAAAKELGPAAAGKFAGLADAFKALVRACKEKSVELKEWVTNEGVRMVGPENPAGFFTLYRQYRADFAAGRALQGLVSARKGNPSR